MSYLPDQNQVFVPAARLFARRLDEARPVDFGLTRTFEVTLEVEEVELRNNNATGTNDLFTTRAKTVGGTINIELDLFTARNLAMHAYGEEALTTQAAATGLTIDEDDVVAGQMTRLPRFNLTAVTLTADGVPLVLGVDYALDASAGVIRWLRSFPNVQGTYGCSAILAEDGRSVVSLLTARGGIELILTSVGTSDVGRRVMADGHRVRLTPGAGLALISQDADFGGLTLSGRLVYNDQNPDAPYGTITYL